MIWEKRIERLQGVKRKRLKMRRFLQASVIVCHESRRLT